MKTAKDKAYQFSKADSWKMFNEISPRYDLLNHLLSFGLDIHWRNRLSAYMLGKANQTVLDLATGTADVLLAIVNNHQNVQRCYGLDMAEKMLEIGRQKVKEKALTEKISLQQGDANKIPFDDGTFDTVTMAFGIRNVEDPTVVMKEMHRVLKVEGRTLILEFSLPQSQWLRHIHLFYLRNVVPVIGAFFSGHYQAYRYLNQTIESFPYGDKFCALLQKNGFQNVKANLLLFGIATIYQADKG